MCTELCFRLIMVSFMPTRLADILPKDYDKRERKRVRNALKQTPPTECQAIYDPPYPWYQKGAMCLFSMKTFVELISSYPYYLHHVASHRDELIFDRVFNSIYVLRLIVTVFKLKGMMQVLSRTLSRSFDAFCYLGVLFGLAVIIFSVAMWLCEGGIFIVTKSYPNGVYVRPFPFSNQEYDYAPSLFSSIPAAMYWAVVTLTTVGYGDMTATTKMGYFITTVASVTGLLVLALPISILGATFSIELAKYNQQVLEQKELLRRNRLHKSLKFNDMNELSESKELEALPAAESEISVLQPSGEEGDGPLQMELVPLGLNSRSHPSTRLLSQGDIPACSASSKKQTFFKSASLFLRSPSDEEDEQDENEARLERIEAVFQRLKARQISALNFPPDRWGAFIGDLCALYFAADTRREQAGGTDDAEDD